MKTTFLAMTWGGALCALAQGHGPSSPPASPAPPLTYHIVVTGSELLAGAYPDSHIHYLTRTLQPLGCRCLGAIIIGDQPEEMISALRYAARQSRFVIVTGGLGPTPNDITRETLSQFTATPLAENPELLAQMAERFKVPADQLRPNLRRQTLVPRSGAYLPNPNGTAAGLVFESSPALIIALPGPPRELRPMVAQHLLPFLQKRFGVSTSGASMTLRFVGAGQSLIDQTIKDHVPLSADLSVSSQFEGSRVDFTFTLPTNRSEDQDRLRLLEKEIREHLGAYLYAKDDTSLEDVLCQRFQERHMKIVLLEVGTGGRLAAGFDQSRLAANVIVGAYSAPTVGALARLLSNPDPSPPPVPSTTQELKSLIPQVIRTTGCSWIIALQLNRQRQPAELCLASGPGEELKTQVLALKDSGEINPQQWTTQVFDILRRQIP